ncbi:MAG: hypothetical protein ABI232_08495 [Jatrophihabitantaceae bacterium]
MLTLLLYGVLAIVVVVVLFLVVANVLPAGEQIAPPLRDEPPWLLPTTRRLVPAEVEAIRLPVAVRGYRFAETDLLLDRLGDELRERDAEIARLRDAALGDRWTRLADVPSAAETPVDAELPVEAKTPDEPETSAEVPPVDLAVELPFEVPVVIPADNEPGLPTTATPAQPPATVPDPPTWAWPSKADAVPMAVDDIVADDVPPRLQAGAEPSSARRTRRWRRGQ